MERRFQKTLSSGQCATFFFTEDKYSDTKEVYIDSVGFIVGESFSANKRWWRDIIHCGDKATGKCGLEALMWALSIIKELQKSYAGIHIYWSNDRRKRAYSWLFRYGFYESVDGDGEPIYKWTT